MKAVQFNAFGTPHEVASCVEVADPAAPGPDEILVAVEAFPINPADLLTLRGEYAVRPPLPAIPGAEAVGRVSAVGEAVSDLRVGDRVIPLTRENWRQTLRLKARNAIPIRGQGDPLQLAMLRVNPATALLMLTRYVDLEPGGWVIQDAANSAVGGYLIQLAKARGWHTVNVVRRAALEAPLKAMGADVVVVDGEDLAARVAQATGGAEIRLGIDAVTGDICIRLGDCLAEGATLVNYGLLSGKPCALRADQVVFKDLTLRGFWLAKWLPQMAPEEVRALFVELAERVTAGELHAEVEATYPIEEIKAALEHAGREARGGKILITPNGPVG